MTAFYLDTSALVKRYLIEIGTAWLRTLLDPATGNTVTISEVTLVEAAAALAARQRGGFITLLERDSAVDLLLRHADTEYSLAPLARATINTALNLTQRHRLRGYDAVQLATVLLIADAYRAAGLTAPTFVAADADLLAAAHDEGLSIENPNDHP
jgi:predicted nucleic acid-binding protein